MKSGRISIQIDIDIFLFYIDISRESWSNIDNIKKLFITYNLRIEENAPYPILSVE